MNDVGNQSLFPAIDRIKSSRKCCLLSFASPKSLEDAKIGKLDSFQGVSNDELEHVNTKGESALMIAAKHRQFALVSHLLSIKANIAHRDYKSNTSLHHAAKNDSAIAIRVLLEHKSDPSWQNQKGETALHIAVKKKAKTSVSILLREKADLHVINHQNKSPLDIATAQAKQTKDLRILNLLDPQKASQLLGVRKFIEYSSEEVALKEIQNRLYRLLTQSDTPSNKIQEFYEIFKDILQTFLTIEKKYALEMQKRYDELEGNPFDPQQFLLSKEPSFETIEKDIKNYKENTKFLDILKKNFNKKDTLKKILLLLHPDKLIDVPPEVTQKALLLYPIMLSLYQSFSSQHEGSF